MSPRAMPLVFILSKIKSRVSRKPRKKQRNAFRAMNCYELAENLSSKGVCIIMVLFKRFHLFLYIHCFLLTILAEPMPKICVNLSFLCHFFQCNALGCSNIRLLLCIVKINNYSL